MMEADGPDISNNVSNPLTQFFCFANGWRFGIGEVDHAYSVDPVCPAPADELGWAAADARVRHARPINL